MLHFEILRRKMKNWKKYEFIINQEPEKSSLICRGDLSIHCWDQHGHGVFRAIEFRRIQSLH